MKNKCCLKFGHLTKIHIFSQGWTVQQQPKFVFVVVMRDKRNLCGEKMVRRKRLELKWSTFSTKSIFGIIPGIRNGFYFFCITCKTPN